MSEKLASLNEELAEKAKRRRRFTIVLSVCALIVTAVMMIIEILSVSTFQYQAGGAIIGGADGPAYIYLISPGFGIIGFIVIVVILAASIYGLFIAGKK